MVNTREHFPNIPKTERGSSTGFYYSIVYSIFIPTSSSFFKNILTVMYVSNVEMTYMCSQN